MSGRLRLDPIACDGHALCAELFPERIRLDDWGFPLISDEPVPPALQRYARSAVAACPRLALTLVVEPTPAAARRPR